MQRIPGALINARYSTDNQNPDSIEVQVQKCTEWCHQNGIPILGVYADEATSGMKDSRPHYERMMTDLRRGVGDMVVIYDQSRMFRKMTAWFDFRDQLSAIGVTVVSVTQPMIGKDLRDPTNFLTEGSMALFNQIWALQSRQKTMEKMRYMARNGQYTGGKPALGYEVVDGRLAICEPEAEIVRRIFTEYASGRSYRDIIAGLNADGLKTKRGNTFGANSLHSLLKNEKYIGTLIYGAMPYREDGTRNSREIAPDHIRIENAVPAIVDKELFDKVQAQMAVNKRQQGGRPAAKRSYPLKGKVFCADCKSAMTISTSKGNYDYYKCAKKKRAHTCNAGNISVDYLEQRVADAVRAVLGTPGNVDKLIKILRDQSGEIQADAVQRLQRMIREEQEISRKLDNATDAVLNGLASATLTDKIRQLEQAKATLAKDMRELRATVDATSLPEQRIRDILKDITSGGSGNAALLAAVSRVEVGKDSITIWTILDPVPDPAPDLDDEGVRITPGTGFAVPKQNNPNLFSAGEGFGLFLFLGGQYG